jgi:ATP/maltotriose-dependent transcriptional regulator MalT
VSSTSSRLEDDDSLARVRDALDRHAWQEAYDMASAAAGAAAPGTDAVTVGCLLEAQAEAAWWLGDLDACIEAREAAYTLFDHENESQAAAQAAVWLYEHHLFRAQPAIAGAWLRRARKRIADDTTCTAYGNLVLREAEARHGRGDLDAAAESIEDVIDLSRRLRSAELEAEALQTLGRVRIDQGRTDEGLRCLDDAMLFVLEDHLSPYATGKIYCSLISACEQLGDFRRASEWTDATSRWADRHPLAVFPGLCRVHHAWALECRGEWKRAEQEVVRACGQLAGISPAHAAAGYAELGEIRRRLGDVDGAEAAFRDAELLCGRAPPGLALVRLAQGRLDAARTIITTGLLDEPWNRLARAKLLPAFVQIAVAAGDADAAAAAIEELSSTANAFGSAAVAASATTARGRLLLARGDATACPVLRQAVQQWQDLEMPYEVATARLLLAQACRAAGDEEAASASLAAARAAFEMLGAELDARAAQQLDGTHRAPAGLTSREVEVLKLVATGASNKDIAASLVLSEKTVARHLSNIFTKAGVTSRSAATAFAFDSGIMTRSGPSNHAG